MLERIRSALSDYAPTRGVALILSLGLMAWGVWVMLPFETFVNPIYGIMDDLASEVTWGALFVFSGASLGYGVWTKALEWIQRGAYLGFVLWTAVSIFGAIADPTQATTIVRITVALMHMWVYIQVKIHPELVSGEIKITDLKQYVEEKKETTWHIHPPVK